MAAANNDSTYSLINNHYSGLARTTPHDSEISQKIAKAFAYDDEDLGAIPTGANLGVSCGNPVVLGKLRQVSFDLNLLSATKIVDDVNFASILSEKVLSLGLKAGYVLQAVMVRKPTRGLTAYITYRVKLW